MFDYLMNGKVLQNCNKIRDIGIMVDSKLNWNYHIENCVSKANKIMGLVKRTLGFTAPVVVKKQLYVSLVRSGLEYCSQVWSGTTSQNVLLIERLQRSATRYILQRPDLDYKDRLKQLDILPLTYRREYLDMCMFFKCKNGIQDLNVNEYVQFTSENVAFTRNRLDKSKLRIPKTKTALYQKTYFNRIVQIWNALPETIRDNAEINIFKKQAYAYFTNMLHNHFDCENKCTWTVYCRCQKCQIK
jgi:hypothetical protein